MGCIPIKSKKKIITVKFKAKSKTIKKEDEGNNYSSNLIKEDKKGRNSLINPSMVNLNNSANSLIDITKENKYQYHKTKTTASKIKITNYRLKKLKMDFNKLKKLEISFKGLQKTHIANRSLNFAEENKNINLTNNDNNNNNNSDKNAINNAENFSKTPLIDKEKNYQESNIQIKTNKNENEHQNDNLNENNINEEITRVDNNDQSKQTPNLILITEEGEESSNLIINNPKELNEIEENINGNMNLNFRQNKKNNNTLKIKTSDENIASINESSSLLSPINILRKLELNQINNFTVDKKIFLYQIKMCFIQAKKLYLTKDLHGNNMDNLDNKDNVNNMNNISKNKNMEEGEGNNKPSYFDIMTNYSNIKITDNPNDIVYDKFDDGNIQINNYLIYKSRCLGKGGYSSVYLAKNLDNNKEIAVKITEKKARANKNKKLYDYVKEEVVILKRLHSKYIVEVYEIIETKKQIFIFMEYMKKNSLFNSIKTLNGFQTWKYFRNLICAVQHCHEIGLIVHRDINVNNLLISDNDILKLSDFGISIIIQKDNDLLSCNCGPSTYTPPEKIYNNNNQYYHGKLGDIWLIGVTLFHMVYKKPLFVNFGNLTIEDYQNIKLPNDEIIDTRIADLIIRMLDFYPERRPTMNEIIKDKWVTHNDEFPLPDIYEEALEYCYKNTFNEVFQEQDNDNNL